MRSKPLRALAVAATLGVAGACDFSSSGGDRICVMSGSPGRTRAGFDVDVPRPRDLGLTDTVEFAHFKRLVRESLETEAA